MGHSAGRKMLCQHGIFAIGVMLRLGLFLIQDFTSDWPPLFMSLAQSNGQQPNEAALFGLMDVDRISDCSEIRPVAS